MNTPSVHLTFRDMPVSDAAEARCWTEAATLAERFQDILGCHVTIARMHHWRGGDLFEIQIKASTPRGPVLAVRGAVKPAIGEDLETAIGEAFETLCERLEQDGRSLKKRAAS